MKHLALPLSLLVAALAGAAPLTVVPAQVQAQAMKGTFELRCQDPKTRQWVVAGRIGDPEIVDRPGGGREVRGRGTDGKPLTLAMPADRTCMLSGV